MFARMTTIHGAEGKTDAAVKFVQNVGRPALEAADGSRGAAVFVDDEAGRTVVASYWDSAEAMRASESAMAGLRGQLAAVGGGDVMIESYEVAVAQRLSVPPAGSCVRLMHAQGDPGQTDELVAFYREQVLPVIIAVAGLCSVQLLIDRESGKAISVTAWQDQAALDAAQVQLPVRRPGPRQHCTEFGLTGVEGYTMVGTTVRMS